MVVIAGKEYGTGSSRDWAAKGTFLLGVKAVIAESFERIHRSNLVGMGVLPLQFEEGQSWKSLGLTGRETFDITGLGNDVKPGQTVNVKATREDGSKLEFQAVLRLDSLVDVDYYRNGGILQTVLRQIMKEKKLAFVRSISRGIRYFNALSLSFSGSNRSDKALYCLIFFDLGSKLQFLQWIRHFNALLLL